MFFMVQPQKVLRSLLHRTINGNRAVTEDASSEVRLHLAGVEYQFHRIISSEVLPIPREMVNKMYKRIVIHKFPQEGQMKIESQILLRL